MNLKHSPFQVNALYKKKGLHPLHFVRQKASFIIAILSLIAFVVGTMVGQQGVYGFWTGVMGKGEESNIVFTGTIAPVRVPDESWQKYQNGVAQTAAQVPAHLWRDLPAYDVAELSKVRDPQNITFTQRVYSTPDLGAYSVEKNIHHGGGHLGVDIDVPEGTKVVSIANGIVDKVANQAGGFGQYIMIRHPNVPDANNPGLTTTIYSIYAHLSQIIVSPGQIVAKGQQIGLSGRTGYASGPHLHVQVENDQAPYHPYWHFTNAEAAAAKLTFSQAVDSTLNQDKALKYTISPMLFVQQYQNFTSSTVIAQANLRKTDVIAGANRHASPLSIAERTQLLQQERLKSRVSRKQMREKLLKLALALADPVEPPASPDMPSVTPPAQTASSAAPTPAPASRNGKAEPVHFEIRLKETTFNGRWMEAKVYAVDQDGSSITSPFFSGRLTMKTFFGTAQIVPGTLTMANFAGKSYATVRFLPNGSKTVILSLESPNREPVISDPVKPVRQVSVR